MHKTLMMIFYFYGNVRKGKKRTTFFFDLRIKFGRTINKSEENIFWREHVSIVFINIVTTLSRDGSGGGGGRLSN